MSPGGTDLLKTTWRLEETSGQVLVVLSFGTHGPGDVQVYDVTEASDDLKQTFIQIS